MTLAPEFITALNPDEITVWRAIAELHLAKTPATFRAIKRQAGFGDTMLAWAIGGLIAKGYIDGVTEGETFGFHLRVWPAECVTMRRVTR